MYELGIRRTFSAAHQLRGYQGKCENLHGHTFAVELRVRARILDEVGLAMDFTDLKSLLDRLLESYDHALLNQVPPFDRINPSSENLARTISDHARGSLPQGVELAGVTVFESPDAWSTYTPE